MTEYTSEDFFLTTAEEERNHFTGRQEPQMYQNPNAIVPPGIYRIIDGELYRIHQGVAHV